MIVRMLANGDEEDRAVWRRIKLAIEALQAALAGRFTDWSQGTQVRAEKNESLVDRSAANLDGGAAVASRAVVHQPVS